MGTPSNRMIVCAAWLVFSAWAAHAGQPPPAPPLFDTVLNQPAYPSPASAPSDSLFAPPPQPYPSPELTPRRMPPTEGPGLAPPDQPQNLWSRPPAEAALGLADRPITEEFKPAQIIAWVGDQPIQVGDIMPLIEQALAPQLSKLSPEELQAAQQRLEQQKEALMRQALGSAIENKLLFLDFLRQIPADKKKEVLPRITKRAEEQFYEKQMPEAMKKAKVESPAELDAFLRRYGSSLDKQKQMFLERVLGQSVLGQKINYEPEVTHQEMLDHYHAHAAEFDRPAQARWEKLSVRFDRFPSRAEAWAALAHLGNEVLRGAPLDAVARRNSQGTDASDGGQHDWTTQGSLASEVLDQAIFTLPVGLLSERIEDEREFHIVRVIERREASRVPFVEAQKEIKEKLRKNKVRDQVTAYVAKLKKETHVWTIYDQPAPETEAATAQRGGAAGVR